MRTHGLLGVTAAALAAATLALDPPLPAGARSAPGLAAETRAVVADTLSETCPGHGRAVMGRGRGSRGEGWRRESDRSIRRGPMHRATPRSPARLETPLRSPEPAPSPEAIDRASEREGAAEPDGSGLFARTCSWCHAAPDPRIHDPAEWGDVIERMRRHMERFDVAGIDDAEARTIVGFLRSAAARGERGR